MSNEKLIDKLPAEFVQRVPVINLRWARDSCNFVHYLACACNMSTAHNAKWTRSKTESSRQLQATKRKWYEIVVAVESLFVKKTVHCSASHAHLSCERRSGEKQAEQRNLEVACKPEKMFSTEIDDT